jgi:hypothetical protein
MSDRSAERTAERAAVRGQDDTDTDASRQPLTERIQGKLARAADEHRRNADAPSKQMASQRRSAPAGSGRRAPRRARLRLTRVDPWSVMKTSFLLSVAFGIVTVVSVFIVWTVLGGAGVWDSINATVEDVLGSEAGNFDVTDYISTSRVLGFTMLVAVVDVVLLTAIATLTAFLYNMAAALLGGIEVTLAEDN